MARMSATTAIRQRIARHEKRQPVKLGFFHLVWIFMLCSFVGLVGETLVSFVLDGHWESRAGFIIGPLSPIYGAGAVLITLVGNPLRGRGPLAVFVASGLTGGFFEYVAGWFFETRYGIVAWSYIDQPFNFHGHTSLFMMAVWGAIGIAWVMWALAPTVRLVERMPHGVRRPLTVIAFAFLLVDAALTLTALDCWFLRTAGAPVQGPVQEFFATWFGDSFMSRRFETMSMWPVLANR